MYDSDSSSSNSEVYSDGDTYNSSDDDSHTSDICNYEVNVKPLKNDRRSPNLNVTYDDDKSVMISHQDENNCLFMHSMPLTPDKNYFEIQITGLGPMNAIGIGIAYPRYSLHRMPGWNSKSVGYHSDDGKLFKARGCGTVFGPTCTELDRMGCGINFGSIASVDMFTKRAKVDVFFTKNGLRVGRMVSTHYPRDGFFPVIGMQSRGDSVILFPPEPFPERPLSLGLGLGLKGMGNSMMLVDSFEEQAGEWAVLNNLQCCHDTLRFVGEVADDTVGLAIASWCFSRKRPYFEVEIVRTTSKCETNIGVATTKHPLTSMPGRSHQSIAYKADTGHVLGRKIPHEKMGPVCSQGSRIGVMVCFPRTAEERSSCVVVNGVSPMDEKSKKNKEKKKNEEEEEKKNEEDEEKKNEEKMMDEEDTNVDDDDGGDEDDIDDDDNDAVDNDDDDENDYSNNDDDDDDGDDDDEYYVKKKKKADDNEVKESENETRLLFFVDGKLVLVRKLESSVQAESYRPVIGLKRAGQIIRFDFNALSG